MSIETSYCVRRSDAKKMLEQKGITVSHEVSNQVIKKILYLVRDSIFENYGVFDDDYIADPNRYWNWKTHW